MAVERTAVALGLKLNRKLLDYLKKEQFKPEFLKINPMHSAPTINDNGFVLFESRAIIIYLQEKYGRNDSLYPKDPKARGIINQRLFFDAQSLFPPLAAYFWPFVLFGKTADPEKFKAIAAPMDFSCCNNVNL